MTLYLEFYFVLWGMTWTNREMEVVRRRRVAESISCSRSKGWVEGPPGKGSSGKGKRQVRCLCSNGR